MNSCFQGRSQNLTPPTMEKLVNITAALYAGKLPSTQQIDSFLVWLNESAIPAARPSDDTDARLSDHGRILADDIRSVLDSYKSLNSNKNSDNLLQEAVWHLTEGDVNTAVDAPNINKKEVSADIEAVRTSLRTILTLVWQSLFSEDNPLLEDFASFARLGLADAAEIIEDQAGRTKEGLRNVEQDVEDGTRDSLGRDKTRLEDEQDARVTFEHRMDTVKDTGSQAIGAHQSTKSKAQDLQVQGTERLRGAHYNAYYKACERAQNDPKFHSALSTVLDTLEKWIFKALDVSGDDSESFTIETFIADSTPEQHVPQALGALKTLLDRFANPESSVDAVLGKAQLFVSAVRANSGDVKAWVNDAFAYARRVLDEPEYPRSEEASAVRQDLDARGRTLVDPDTDAGRAWAELQETTGTFGAALAADGDIERVRSVHAQLGKDAARGFTEAGKEAALEFAPWFWRDLFAVYVPRVLDILTGIPIPRMEYVDSDVELVLEDLDISSVKINPAHISISNTTNVDVRTSEAAEASVDGVGSSTQIRLQAVQVALRDVSFYYKDKHTPVPGPPRAFTGLLTLTMPAQGLDADIRVRFIQSAKERTDRQAYHIVETVAVKLADDVQVGVRESNHAVTLALFKPAFKRGLRAALGRVLGAQLRAALESADGVAWDVGRRAEVFRDTGMGGGAALAGAMWSEAGKLIRERDVGVRATGTGVVVLRDEGSEGDARFTVGAEPQVLPGEKHGPAGTGSQSLGAHTGGAGGAARGGGRGAQGQVKGLVGEGRRQVRSFRGSVDEMATMEKNNPGWQSAAFDL
ncbi:hypothetical protein DFH07DRAFT_933600 [Mycena maculata]|uniref:Uncharacterized protein n=1 Tax=Mycena maculata TaxID=230809 RepID=A0AAD7HDP9_9AGAR|nr:hypothetical protein DFH07DRAFT_933600 [Mycena maculata]